MRAPGFWSIGLRYLRSNGVLFVLEASIDGGVSGYYVWNNETQRLARLDLEQARAPIVTGISDSQIIGGLDYGGDSVIAAEWSVDGQLRRTGRSGVLLYSDEAQQLITEAKFVPGGIVQRTTLFGFDGGRELTFQEHPVQALASRPTGEFAGYCLDAGYMCCSSIEVVRESGQP
jgi:hypothetical protein